MHPRLRRRHPGNTGKERGVPDDYSVPLSDLQQHFSSGFPWVPAVRPVRPFQMKPRSRGKIATRSDAVSLPREEDDTGKTVQNQTPNRRQYHASRHWLPKQALIDFFMKNRPMHSQTPRGPCWARRSQSCRPPSMMFHRDSTFLARIGTRVRPSAAPKLTLPYMRDALKPISSWISQEPRRRFPRHM